MKLETKITAKSFEKMLEDKLFSEFAIDIASATDEQLYRALALIVRGMLSRKRKEFMARTYGTGSKQVYYLCMEFLMGRSLKTSLFNLGPVSYTHLSTGQYAMQNWTISSFFASCAISAMFMWINPL